MRLPVYYYSLQPEETINFGRQPPGHMHVHRLINSLPAWQKLRAGFVLKPKTLLVNLFAKKSQLKAIQEKLNELMDQGFTIHWRTTSSVTNKSRTQLLSRNPSLSWTAIPSLITDTSLLPENFLELKKNDNLLIIQDGEMQALLDNQFGEQELRLTSSDFFSYTFNKLSNNLCIDPLLCIGPFARGHLYDSPLPKEYFNNLGLKTRLTIDLYPGPSLSIEGLTNLPEVEVNAQILKAYVNDATIDQLINGSSPASSSTSNSIILPVSLDDFKFLEELIYYLEPHLLPLPMEKNYPSKDEHIAAVNQYLIAMVDVDYGNPNNNVPAESPIDELLRYTPNIKSLKLGRLKTQAQWPLMTQLTKLTIGYVYDANALRNLLEQCPNLEEIEFKEVNRLNFNSKITWPILPKMKRFIHMGRGNSVLPTQLFSAMPGLEYLESKTKISKIPKLNHLTSLYVTRIDSDLVEILENCPALKDLRLSSYQLKSPKHLLVAINKCTDLTCFSFLKIPKKDIPFWEQLLETIPALKTESMSRRILESYLQDNHTPDIDYFITKIRAYPEANRLAYGSCRTPQRLHFLKELQKRAPYFDPCEIDNQIMMIEYFLGKSPTTKPLSTFSDLFKNWSKDTFKDFNFDSNTDTDWNLNLGELFNSIDLNQVLSTLSSLHESGDSGLINTKALNQAFNPQGMQGHDPNSYHEKPFQYQGGHHTLSQNMVIDQLSQFLTLTNKSIPRIQDGICSALAHLCNRMSPEDWLKLLTAIRDWDGKKSSLVPIHYKIFAQVYDYVKRYQLVSIFNLFRRPLSSWSKTWMGEAVLEWLNTQNQSLILSNAWHAIALRPLQKGPFDYFAYNPNFIEGGVLITHAQLPDFLKTSLGDLSQLLIEGHHEINIDCPNPSDFIQDGGLLTLMRARNKETLLSLLINKEEPLTIAALEGILLRDTDGKPAWLLALASSNTDLIHYSLTLLTQFIAAHPSDYWMQLQKSAELVKNFSLHAVIEQLIKLPEKQRLAPESRQLIDELPELLSALSFIEQDREAFKAIGKKENPLMDPQSYPIKLLQAETKSQLIEMPDSQSIQALRFKLQDLAEKTGRVLLYIDKPEALSCSNPFVELQADGKSGLFKEGPGGALHKALTSSQPPLILINCDGFPKSAMVRFNALIDENPNADGTVLPEGCKIIALLNPQNPNCYRGRDLYSRFESKEIYPFAADALELPELPIRPDPGPDDYIIDLFNALDWKERLLGYWAPRGDHLEFIQGELQKALLTGRPIAIANAPWKLHEFTEFWQEEAVRKYIFHEDQRLHLPDPFHFAEIKGYNWEEKLSCIVHCDRQIDTEALILNPYTMSDFLIKYQCINETESILALEGLLKEHANSTLSLNVSHTLSPDAWARFFYCCNENKVDLQLHLGPEVELPPDCSRLIHIDNNPNPACLPAMEHTAIILSDAPDTTRAQLGDDYLSIDISECDPTDLLDSIDGYFDADPRELRLRFHNTHGLLPLLFEDNPRIILRGQFSSDHIQALMPLLQNRLGRGMGNQLILLPDNPLQVDFSYLPVQKRRVSIAEKLFYLPFSTLPDELFAREDLSQLRARQRYAQPTTASSSNAAQLVNTGEEAWLGLTHLPARLPMGDFDAQNSAAITEAFTQGRIDAVLHAIKQSPFVFLTGLTAVGKSTFVEKELAAVDGILLHHSTQSIEAWANDHRPGTKILFLDEANLAGLDWSEFEGLFETPPHIRIKNKLISLSSEHRVIFAGNPISYGDKRRLAPLFERHGNAILFEPMPQEYIYEKMLRPLFNNSAMEEAAPEIALEFLRIYKFLCRCSVSKVLISPRELQMMALLTLVHQGPDDPQQTARYYARILAQDLVPEAYQTEFNTEFPQVSLHPRPPAANTSSDSKSFFYTPSRLPAANLLDDLLNLRKLRYNQPKADKDFLYGSLGGVSIEGEPGVGKTEMVLDKLKAHEDFLYGGLGGIIIEGEPGVGKTEMVLDKLKARGYLNGDSNQRFYHIPASWNQKAKEDLLLKAFHEGAVVLIDEINSTALMEDFLNDLLMGKSPDKKRPANPGFLLIGTQNPASMGGRLVASNALQRRMINLRLPPYTRPEMLSILRHMGLGNARAQVLLNIFLEESKTNPELTFRDLIRRAKAILRPQNPAICYDSSSDDEADLDIGPQAAGRFLFDNEDSNDILEPIHPEEQQPLLKKIANLKTYGDYLANLDDPIRQKEGIKTIQYAEALEKNSQEPEVFQHQLKQAYQALGSHYNKASFFFGQKTQRQKIIAEIREQESKPIPFISRHLAKLTVTPLIGIVAGLIATAMMIAFPIGLPGLFAFAGVVAGISLLAAGLGFGIGALIDHFREQEEVHRDMTHSNPPIRSKVSSLVIADTGLSGPRPSGSGKENLTISSTTPLPDGHGSDTSAPDTPSNAQRSSFHQPK